MNKSTVVEVLLAVVVVLFVFVSFIFYNDIRKLKTNVNGLSETMKTEINSLRVGLQASIHNHDDIKYLIQKIREDTESYKSEFRNAFSIHESNTNELVMIQNLESEITLLKFETASLLATINSLNNKTKKENVELIVLAERMKVEIANLEVKLKEENQRIGVVSCKAKGAHERIDGVVEDVVALSVNTAIAVNGVKDGVERLDAENRLVHENYDWDLDRMRVKEYNATHPLAQIIEGDGRSCFVRFFDELFMNGGYMSYDSIKETEKKPKIHSKLYNKMFIECRSSDKNPAPPYEWRFGD